MKIANPRSFSSSLVLLACFPLVAAHAAEFGVVQLDKSNIQFTSRQMGVPVKGKFGKFIATAAFDPAKPDATTISVSVDVGSIDAGSKEANDEVVTKSWFNTRMFPMATFTSTKVKSLGNNKFEATGNLAIKGKTQPITAPFTFKQDGANGVFDGSFTIKRIEFAIGEGPWADLEAVANEVQVTFHVLAAPNPASAANTTKTTTQSPLKKTTK